MLRSRTLGYLMLLASTFLELVHCECDARVCDRVCDGPQCSGGNCTAGATPTDNCLAACKDTRCSAACFADKCVAKCDGIYCESGCQGAGCRASCTGLNCIVWCEGAGCTQSSQLWR